MPAALAIELGGVDVTDKVDFPTIAMQLAGSQETASCEFDLSDVDNTVDVANEMVLTVTEVGTAEVVFGGLVRSSRPVVAATGRTVHIVAADYNNLLDRQVVISDTRAAGESDADRLEYLMTTYGDQFSADYSQLSTLNASLPAQTFRGITLRQSIERVLGQASTLSMYHVDPLARLVTYDRSSLSAAPFDIVVGTPGAGEIAVDDFSIEFDSSGLANAIYVVGATAAGSGWFTNPTSITAYGRRERFFNAPDSDTSGKAAQVGAAVLQDQKNPIPRGSFTTTSPNDGWRIGQSVVVTSAQHGLSAVTYRIARVSVKYLNGAGDRQYRIEIGAPLPTLSALLSRAHGSGGGGGGWSAPGSSGWWRGFQIDDSGNLFNCDCGSGCCPPWDGVGTPSAGQQVLQEFVAAGDGTTAAWVTAVPYMPGTLRVYFNTKNVTSTKSEDDPTTGDFSVSTAPTASPLQNVYVSYYAA